MNTRTRPELSVVIPAKNESHHLPSLLTCLNRQDYSALTRTEASAAARTKVYVADANSTDGTPEAAVRFRGWLNVEVIPGGLPGVGRNRGAAVDDSEYILFLDADVEIADPTLLRRAVQEMRRRNLHALTVDITCPAGSLADKAMLLGNNLVQRLSTRVLPFGTGMFLMVERKRFEELGGFDESAAFAEDFLFTKQISRGRFAVLRNGAVQTSNRRFRTTGHARMAWLFFLTFLNSANRAHFHRDHGYWRPHASASSRKPA